MSDIRLPITGNDYLYLEQMTDRSLFYQNENEKAILEAEEIIGLQFPPDLRDFMARYGGISTRSQFNLFGVGRSKGKSPSIVWAVRWLQFSSLLPAGFLPVGTIDWHVFACLELTPPGRVISWHDDLVPEQQPKKVLAASYSEFLQNISKELLLLEKSLAILKQRVVEMDEKNHYTNTGEGKLPRSQDWRVHRICSRDIILGVLAVRHQMGVNCLLVDLFLPIDLPPFETSGSLIFMTLFILGDAYRCGGTMEIRFTANVDGGQVPRKLQALARQVGAPIKPESLAQNRLDPDDSLRLYAALTGFSTNAREYIQQKSINPLKACFVIHRGIWSKPEVEMLLFLSRNPERIFSGGPAPADWRAWSVELHLGRSAILGGYLTRALARRSPQEASEDIEDDNREVTIAVLAEFHALRYAVCPPAGFASDAIPVPWLLPGTGGLENLSAGQEFLALPRARDRFELSAWFDGDLRQAIELAATHACPVFLLLPSDFLDVRLDPIRPGWVEKAAEARIGLIICGEGCAALDDQVLRRWHASRIVRE